MKEDLTNLANACKDEVGASDGNAMLKNVESISLNKTLYRTRTMEKCKLFLSHFLCLLPTIFVHFDFFLSKMEVTYSLFSEKRLSFPTF